MIYRVMSLWEILIAAFLAFAAGTLIARFGFGVPLAELHLVAGLAGSIATVSMLNDIGRRVFGEGGDND